MQVTVIGCLILKGKESTQRDVRWLKRWYYNSEGNKNKVTVFDKSNNNVDSKLRKGKVEIGDKDDSLTPNQLLTSVPEETDGQTELENDNKATLPVKE